MPRNPEEGLQYHEQVLEEQQRAKERDERAEKRMDRAEKLDEKRAQRSDRHLETLTRLVIEIGQGTRENREHLRKLMRAFDRFVAIESRRNGGNRGHPGRA